MSNIIIQDDRRFIKELQVCLQKNTELTDWNLFTLLYQYKKATMIKNDTALVALNYLPHIQFLEHQLETARKVITEMNGRAILADEVGLGKTIEAGLILKEYMLRGYVKNALILVPASLVNQWVTELQEKFYLAATSYRKNFRWDHFPILVASLDLAKQAKHRKEILKIEYDFVIVDEAHKLKNHRTLNYAFVRDLKKKYCLLLTATPLQNNLLELFNLVSLVRPGYLGNMEKFRQEYVKNRSQNLAYLQQIVKKVMIRNRRKDLNFDSISRHIQTIWLTFTPEEQNTYEELQNLLDTSLSFQKFIYLKEICSSREACYLSLLDCKDKWIQENRKPILQKIEQLPHHTKALKVLELIRSLGKEKVIIFTQYRATQYYLQAFLQENNIIAVSFYGGLKAGRKDWIKYLFANHAQVLIATEAGGEGINLQFCKYIINYDLPWNPMRLEQRIGRIHRYGQKHDVTIFNIVLKNTIEEHIVKLLYEKIEIFERAIGKLDKILALFNGNTLDDEIKQIFFESASPGEMKVKMDNLLSVIENLSATKQSDIR